MCAALLVACCSVLQWRHPQRTCEAGMGAARQPWPRRSRPHCLAGTHRNNPNAASVLIKLDLILPLIEIKCALHSQIQLRSVLQIKMWFHCYLKIMLAWAEGRACSWSAMPQHMYRSTFHKLRWVQTERAALASSRSHNKGGSSITEPNLSLLFLATSLLFQYWVFLNLCGAKPPHIWCKK
jgi:hypothetical protein